MFFQLVLFRVCFQFGPNSTRLVSSRHVSTPHVRRVECVERVETSVSSRAVGQALHSQNAWARHVERVVSCRDMTWRAKWNLSFWCSLRFVKITAVHPHPSSASEMTCIVSGGALNSTHSLTSSSVFVSSALPAFPHACVILIIPSSTRRPLPLSSRLIDASTFLSAPISLPLFHSPHDNLPFSLLVSAQMNTNIHAHLFYTGVHLRGIDIGTITELAA